MAEQIKIVWFLLNIRFELVLKKIGLNKNNEQLYTLIILIFVSINCKTKRIIISLPVFEQNNISSYILIPYQVFFYKAPITDDYFCLMVHEM